jgi:hypothetical protein
MPVYGIVEKSSILVPTNDEYQGSLPPGTKVQFFSESHSQITKSIVEWKMLLRQLSLNACKTCYGACKLDSLVLPLLQADCTN